MRGEEILRLEIPDVEPYPWPRTRTNRGGKHYLPAPYVAYRDLVAMHLNAAHRGELEAGPLRVVLGFYRSTKRKADVDNLAKSILDAGIGTTRQSIAASSKIASASSAREHSPALTTCHTP